MAEHNQYGEVSVALPRLAAKIMTQGDELGSRQGDRTQEMIHQHFGLSRPWNREVLTPGRKASLPAQIAETMWVLAGRNDVEWLSHYLPRAAEFSDDGVQWRGGYGPRLRAWAAMDSNGDYAGPVDQLRHVVELLRRDRSTRRAVMSIYDPAVDTEDGKDIPCNNWLHFLNRDGKLHLHVTTRSNDLIWGWSGINQFEWSALLEIVAGMTGTLVGTLQFSVGSLHIYDRHWKRAREMDPHDPTLATVLGSLKDSPRFRMDVVTDDEDRMGRLETLVEKWFAWEKKLRTRTWSTAYALDMINGFPEPMLQSWLRVIAHHWYGEEEGFLTPLAGTRLALAATLSPNSPVKHPEPVVVPLASGGMLPGKAPVDPFIEFVAQLHQEKDAVYGDSWKRRGEAVAIQANIARKVDRLGVAGAGDTAADTVIDLLVYLVKYRLWLTDVKNVLPPAQVSPSDGVFNGTYSDDPAFVSEYLRKLPVGSISEDDAKESIARLKSSFETLLDTTHPVGRAVLVQGMILDALPVARRLWDLEVLTSPTVGALVAAIGTSTVAPTVALATVSNATRSWAGYGDGE